MANSLHDIPGTHVDQIYVPAIAAGENDGPKAVWIAPFDAKVTGFKYCSLIAVTGADTNSVTLEVRGVNAATTVRGSTALVNGTDLTALVDVSLGSVTAFNVSAGDTLNFYNNEIGTGLGAAVGPGVWAVEYEGR